jgi:hypothetical protein
MQSEDPARVRACEFPPGEVASGYQPIRKRYAEISILKSASFADEASCPTLKVFEGWEALLRAGIG